MDDYDRGYRDYAAGDRKREIVRGKSFNNPYIYPKARSPEQPPYFFPPNRRSKSRYSSGGSGVWCFGDPEMKRRRRVASYKVYSAEGKVKASLRKGFRWIKNKCSELVHGW